MAPKKPAKPTKLQVKAGKKDKVLTGPKGSKPQSTTTNRVRTQGGTTISKPAPSAGRRINPKAAKPKPARPALPPGRQGGPLATRAGTRPALPPGRPGGSLAIRPGGRGGAGAILTTAGMAGADVVGTRAGNAIGSFLRNQTNQSRNDPRRNTPGGRSNPGRSSGKPATDGRYTPGSQQVAIPKPKPKPAAKPAAKPTRAFAPSRSSSASAPSRAPSRSSAASRPTTSSRRPAPKPPAASSAPKAPKVAATSGIGPVKSGDEYARTKGSLREQARRLREMQAESRKRQGK